MATVETTLSSFAAEIRRLGLSPEALERHAAAIRGAVERRARPCFKILDTCRKDNGGILPDGLCGDAAVASAGHGFVAFVPAAGAASRYSEPLFQLENALEAGAGGTEIERYLEALRHEGAAAWPLPANVQRLLKDPTLAQTMTAEGRDRLLADLQLPKALMPCVKEGTSFLQVKLAEHRALRGLDGQIFVARAGTAESFRRAAPSEFTTLEQGPMLSTLRFNADVSPYVDEHGHLSPVPAGHGALVGLFPDAQRQHPRAHSLFVRNIDNVMGTSSAAVAATARFLGTHRLILTAVVGIRSALSKQRVADAADIARSLLARLPPIAAPSPAGADPTAKALATLAELQSRLFHTRLPGTPQLAALRALFDRPVNTLGQVPNTGRDVGGTPCFVEVGGAREKICIEVPHVSDADRRDYLADPARATHFNPGFVAAEFPTDPDHYQARNQDFWLKAEKTFRGTKVLYFETVLYELLGNSRLANCVFVEVPRLVFNPHKTLKDAVGKSLSDWAITSET